MIGSEINEALSRAMEEIFFAHGLAERERERGEREVSFYCVGVIELPYSAERVGYKKVKFFPK